MSKLVNADLDTTFSFHNLQAPNGFPLGHFTFIEIENARNDRFKQDSDLNSDLEFVN
jgi:hypothetical protein